MINRIMRLLHKIIVHLLNMCTSCVRLTSPIDGFSNLEFCCPYIITSAYYRLKTGTKTALTTFYLTQTRIILIWLPYILNLTEHTIDFFASNIIWQEHSGLIRIIWATNHKTWVPRNEDASALMLTEMKIDRTRRTMDR